MIENKKRYSAELIYNLEINIPIPARDNKLSRPLIPLFRHSKYNLSNWKEYAQNIKMNINH